MNYYEKSAAILALGLVFAAILAKLWPPLALLAVPLVLALGEEVLLWAYTRVAPLEPIRVLYEDGRIKAAYDPRHKLYHVFWRAEPVHSLYGIAAAPRLQELYTKLSLQRGEWLAYIVLGEEKYLRYTTRRLIPERVRAIEAVLKEYYVLKPAPVWLSSRKVPARWPYLTSLVFLPLAALSSVWFLAYIPIWLMIYRRVRKWYREPYLMFAFSHMSRATALPAAREMLEGMAAAESAAFGMMQKWAVAFTDWPPQELQKMFSRVYEGRDTAKRIIRMQELAPLLERMARFNERPVLLYPFGVADVHSMWLVQDWAASLDFWVLKHGIKALSHDLARFPIFYGGKMLTVGREVQLGFDRFGRPVYVDLDALPTVHGVILGASGMGKSWTVGSWLNVISKKDVRIIAIDPHGDYVNWARLNNAQVIEIPVQLPKDFAKILAESEWFHRLLQEYGFEPIKSEAGVKAWLERLLAPKGIKPDYVDVGEGHLVFSISTLKKDEAMMALFYGMLLVYFLWQYIEHRVERVQTLIVFDEARLISKSGRTVLTDILESIVQGARKYGIAIWFVLQLETQLERDLLRSASLQLIFGGGEDVVKPMAEVLVLDRDDVSYLLTSVTPREASLSGQPYAMAVLRVKPRNLKYHMRIPLDPALKS